MDKINKIVMTTLIVLLGLVAFVSPKNVLADDNEPENHTIYCPLCEHRNDDDPLYNKERQFYQKISLIKSVFGDAIDEVALAAAVIHRYDNKELAYEREYDENFDSNSYKDTWQQASSTNSFGVFGDDSKVDMTQDNYDKVSANEKLDLITTAAIVMIDSNHMGKYSDVCFRDGLAGEGLVGNNDNRSAFVTFYNAVVCGIDQYITIVTTPLQFITNWFSGDNFMVSAESAKRKLVNIKKVCENGYVGGLYNGVASIKDDDIRQETKKQYAQQIIDFSNYYKKLYSVYEEGETCNSNTAGNTGEYAFWKQTDNRWKNIVIGNSSNDTINNIGCLVTSMAIQISRSGTKLGNFPSGSDEFNPGTLAGSLKANNGFDSSGAMLFTGFETIAPHWHMGDYVTLNVSENKKLAEAISKELSSPIEDKQKFIILKIHHKSSTQHWVAVDSVVGETVKIFDPASTGTDLDSNYDNWVVDGYKIVYADDVSFGQNGSNNNGCSNGDEDLNRFIGFLAYNEGHETCNFQGRGEGTGYGAGTLAGDAGGQTTAFGITWVNHEIAEGIGYTSFLDELYSGCTNKEDTERLLLAVIQDGLDWTQKQIDQHGITVTPNEKFALMSVNYGGIVLAVPIMEAIKTYGKDSEQVFEAFKHSFGIDYAIGNGFHGLMRRRLTEYEMFMTANYEAESSNYLQMPYIQNGLAMSKSEVMSHWPTNRGEDLEGFDFAPINGNYSGGSSCELVCRDGDAVCEDEKSSEEDIYQVCGKKNGTTRVLFVGNSRTWNGNIPETFAGIAKSRGYSVDVTKALEGGRSLLYLSYKFADVLSKPYDCVVMQEQTETYLYDYATSSAGAKRLVSVVKAGNSGVMTYLRQVWGLSNSNRAELDRAYGYAETIANDTGSQIIPDGKAFEKSKSKYPDISLLIDERHASDEGGYLSAATIFKKLYGVSPAKSTYYGKIGETKAKKLLKIADEIVPDAKGSKGLTGVVECAKQQLGKPYKHGTQGPDSFDCSGLTYYCYKTVLNVDITPGSHIQWEDHDHFIDVDSMEQLVPGDLIASDGGGHVMIYIGNGQVIHASSPEVGVIQSSIGGPISSARYKHYKG